MAQGHMTSVKRRLAEIARLQAENAAMRIGLEDLKQYVAYRNLVEAREILEFLKDVQEATNKAGDLAEFGKPL